MHKCHEWSITLQGIKQAPRLARGLAHAGPLRSAGRALKPLANHPPVNKHELAAGEW